MHTSNDWRHERKHEENLRLKLKREFPAEVIDDCENMAQLEALKEQMDVFTAHPHSRTRLEREALLYEVEAEGELLEVKV